MSDFPHWPVRPTGSVFFVKGRIGWRNLRHSDFCENGPHLITGMHIDSAGRIDWDSCFHIPKRKFDESPEIQVKVGDLVITKDGTIGKVARIDWLPGDTSLNAHLFLVRPIQPEFCSARFAFHVFTSAAFRNFIENQKSGSTLAGLGEAKFVRFQFPLPTINEQELVSDVLDTLDIAIRETEALIEKLKAIKRGLTHDLLTRGIDSNGQLRPPHRDEPQLYKKSPLGWIPREWEIEPIINLTSNSVIGPFGSDLIASDYRDSGVPVVFVRDVKPDQLIWKSNVFVSASKAQALAAHEVRAGDVVATKMGLPPCVAAVYPESMPCGIVTADIVRLRPCTDRICPDWMSIFINSSAVAKQVEQITAGVTRPKVTLRDVRDLLIGLPPIKEQERVLVRLTALQSRIQLEEASYKKLISEKSGLMDDLLTGRVRVTPLLESMQQAAAPTEA
ncbi:MULTISPECIES: restriction endonuclease subunit S [unclassified Pseudomonas]|uniref:restriction endonuclease subunit S n=1 Tax=unclassified Pseudomonas TaxID=196821 RepID=UPI0008773992|nr:MULTISPECIES: restriction endonuclease subunit S [unclassified Pseudomonas]SCZ46631.1 type I restriction enzyme, S subunit [Pseudomonas sp. NFACC44-2]SDA81222.1 type I restriction enzyme, S subunit [Pseudomonas sp. NFACC51]SEJ88869.1 type I restriction enzyme, S subunit [Pseudomonas sp. NFACC07-1]SFJ22531.1 type I restriction enzyme, S subunit [Pseudomonas sp. NFACC54]SFT25793.1 type I restriction enzyme, S subunit [Pseudomonas sp. NFACC48-1]